MQADDQSRLELEDAIHDLCRRRQLNQAVELAVRGYGPEIRRLMLSVLQDEARAQDAFGLFCEGLVKGLPRFRWESSFRTWAQRMARNACFKLVNASAVRRRHLRLSAVPDQPEGPRSSTSPWQRTLVKERFRALRTQLEPQQRRLLELRLDQQLPWQEVVQLMATSEEALTDETQARRAAALRQQFQRAKCHLRSMALQEGLITSDDTQ
ncbi:RNA polymerase sigma factor [Corallococcus terminator]|uniref:Sigma-70 family RNA polymerase sigma factor n=1 Tax=Corallococcus terminator TaxID=2316733 RepID=A0A3A8JG31_9BACT|nr:sigma-70 family RNA polymerase sigma factor [Corallococcus terminator]RKG88413.1 sigma-70 family RNA polymerase sigma factor [Corallococcus terminator]